ncbi:NACHT, LRR and PYD domains-containing protein 1b allele 2 isoform X2 [Oreochromis niloticus]|uniref:NACHT, LRR and PYD domains-containing protein 1b allele 2 isoform X2 n=1 Tax=Oreochromis niloticus TaxID=8128 RepID=UPI000DF4B7B9|nr:NACHT, LRR and PYD domains-containing protein 1b allele 2 isoform X2 [Oreochromis niloticus]
MVYPGSSVSLYPNARRTQVTNKAESPSSGVDEFKMNKTSSAGSSAEGFDVEETEKEKHSEDEHWPALIHKDWTKLKPEVNSTDADEAPTYSLQSAAGHFECRVSGLRWVCKGKTSFQYQFRSWEGHMERMESRQYMPAGPLMDVTVTAGKLNEVHLPHWICIADVPDILDMFAVVHIDDCGDVVEKVSEVTPTHVKLTEPNFSIIAALIRSIFPPKISCYMLMYYQPNTSFLKLHVYLIRQDPALEQEIDEKYREKNDEKKSNLNFKKIIKHPPDKYLQTERLFSLKADNTSAKIQPKELTLRYNRQNFYEVYVMNPGSELILTLVRTHPADGEPADEPLWKCEIRADDHPESGQAKDERSDKVKENHFVDEHRVELIQRVTNIELILDELLKEKVIQQESYDRIRALQTSQEKMRELYSGPLKAGSASKDVFYQILQTHERLLVNDLC